jgi:hypothetical protein
MDTETTTSPPVALPAVRCTNANHGTFGHECGKPARWVGVQRSGWHQAFCGHCRDHGDEARPCVSFHEIAAGDICDDGRLHRWDVPEDERRPTVCRRCNAQQ